MPANAICFCFSEVEKEMSLKQLLYMLFDLHFGKYLFRYIACVHGSTNGIPISFKVLPMVPLVIPLVPMLMPMVPFALPMVLLVPLVSQWYHL